MSAIAYAPARLETPSKLTLEEAQDIAVEISHDSTASDDLRALAQFVGLLDVNPVQALEDERRDHSITASRLHTALAVISSHAKAE